MTTLAITYHDPNKLQAFKGNSRTHTPAQIDKIKAAITEFGFINPVIVADDKTIIAGHARVQAAIQLGLESVPCIMASHLTEAQRRAFVIADNRLSEDAGWDDAVLRQELHFLNNNGFNVHLTGMDDDQLRKLVQLGEAYTPSLQPGKASSDFTQAEVDRANAALAGKYATAGQQKLLDVTCPHCGNDFRIQEGEFNK